MSCRDKFRYALEPVLLTRRWRLDSLLLELGEADNALRRLKDELAALQEKASQLAMGWSAQTASRGELTIDGFAMATKYMQELAAKSQVRQSLIDEWEQKRTTFAEQALKLKKEIEAIERHREEEHTEFARAQANQAFKAFDDQWTLLQQRQESDTNEC